MPQEYRDEEKIEQPIENTRYSATGGFDSFLPGTHTIKDPTGSNVSVEGQTITINEKADIQAALDALDRSGGGTVFLKAGTYYPGGNITIPAEISLIGAGRDKTIIDFSSRAQGIVLKGISTVIKNNNVLSQLTVQNSNNTAGIDIDFCDFLIIENVRITSCDQQGIKVNRSRGGLLRNIRSDNNTTNGVVIGDAAGARTTEDFLLENVFSDTNGGIGISIAGNVFISTFINCVARSNTGDGFDFTGDADNFLTFLGCRSSSNTGIGFDVDASVIKFIGCQAELNTGGGFDILDGPNHFIGCDSQSNTTFDFNTGVDAVRIVVIGGRFLLTLPDLDDMINRIDIDDRDVQFIGNSNTSSITNKRTLRMKNTSGATMTEGEVVVLKSAAAGNEITTTTIRGDSKVFGMNSVSSAVNNTYGFILTEGFTRFLKVNGTDDIAIGDFLSTYTEVGIAAKARNGDMAFAVALEAYSANDSLGVIDALVISPRPFNVDSLATPLFGDGSTTGTTTISGSTTLTANTYYENLTIGAAGNLNTGGYWVYVQDTLTITSGGKIQRNGNVGGNGAVGQAGTGGAGAGGAGGSAGAVLADGAMSGALAGKAGGDGGAGGIGNGTAGVNGVAGTAQSICLNTNSSSGSSVAGDGGNGSGAPGSGGAGGTGVAGVVNTSNAVDRPRDAVRASIMKDLTTASSQYETASSASSGPGGGGGGGDAAQKGGGGGGGGGSGSPGGLCVIFAKTLSIAGAGAISANGGAGGNGGNGGAGSSTFNTGGGGGGSAGAGGNAGVVVIIYQAKTGAGTMTATGGATGTAGTGGLGQGTGTNGGNGNIATAGSDGLVIEVTTP